MKITPPVVTTQPKLGFTLSAGNITVTFDAGKLQSAPAVTGPWADVNNAASPFKEAVSGAKAKFYRVIVP